MDECFYFTNRTLEDGKGKATAWVLKPECPKCKKGPMGKPVVKGKVKINVPLMLHGPTQSGRFEADSVGECDPPSLPPGDRS